MNRTIEIDEANFESEVLKSRQPVLVEFSTEWSLPSLIMNGAIDEIASEFCACLKVARVKLDSSPNLGLWYNIRCLPTILYFTDGEVRAGVFGSTSKEAVLSYLQPAISASCTPTDAPQVIEFDIASPTVSLNGGDPLRLSDTARLPALSQYPVVGTPLDASLAVRTTQEKPMNRRMKIVVIGGNGLIGKKLVSNLRQQGLEVVAASPSSGVNTLTGEGLAEALAGAQVVVDVSNSPSFSFIPKRGALYPWESEGNAALEFFETSGRNLLTAEAAAGVRHHVALSVVGTDRLQESGYFRAKWVQENLIKASTIPYTIVRATQFFEFVGGIAQSGTVGQTVHLSPALIQSIAADDVAKALAEIALDPPVQGIVEIAGPERVRLDELVREFLRKTGDSREVITDAQARYFGLVLSEQSLVPGDSPRIGPRRFDEWLSRAISQKPVKEVASAATTLK